MPAKLEGIFTPTLVPLDDRGQINEEELRRFVSWLIGRGVHGLYPNGDIVANVDLEDTAPEGAAADGKGHIFVNNESKNTIQVIDVKTWKATASWPLAPCEGPTGITYDKASDGIFSGCNNTSVDPNTGKIVATIKNGTRVDALGWDPSKKL